MTTDTLWQEISIAALLGTQRKPFQPSQSGGALGALLSTPALAGPSPLADAPDPAEGERLLLRAAALTTLHRRGGKLPALKTPVFPHPRRKRNGRAVPSRPAVSWSRF